MNPSKEPVAISGAVMAVVVSGFGVAVAFGAPLTEEQVGVVVAFVGAAIALVTAWQRSKVTPDTAVVERLEGNDAVVAGPANDLAHEGDLVRRLSDTKGAS